ncbi:MAG: hypothetical protein JGK17_06275 [Microcoleus sp. PH2017_10_PVI_O_A]|uniref:hypothetical protein n=1 Tax=unclassified Microcoleus TaxID=2642155 RepID=UPI001E0FB1B9|nr:MULTISPECIES: hypothetical protein [unclassified Microcoleus]TAE84461.1 MAG: hypothetical protein EAZ83_05755 [Oscillatoriales cyanobacterium]MCC3405193.1 hypothetical protein [Microcoleus sp. PH2017_10_PVI_O_A]MCC3459280.1 hypothetical protein [Microcoleus sp. PH2017_11_PCY_U_A]MCC3477405.1 hypothetical protein [Microcoleus sp. PH2017_12_PCY_D_A]MCC3558498.1 hypothetical protein [Microcoleus sp. PH2017_27_LUM_O_A]
MAGLPQHSFFDDDSEYPDLSCGELAVKQYLRLICSADYRSKPFMDDDLDREGLPSPTNNLPLPTNVVTIGRRVTPTLRIKIIRALEVFPTKSQIRVYQLFSEVKACGFRYDCKQNVWEFQTKWKSLRSSKN